MERAIAVACNTRRGVRVLEALGELIHCPVHVASSPEDPWEPPYRSAIRDLCSHRSWSFTETTDVRRGRIGAALAERHVDVLLLVVWRFLVCREVRDLARAGTFVFHDSILPAYRGFSPTVWALVNGEREVGATLFEAVDAVDAGPIIDQERVTVASDAYITDVYNDVTEAYVRLLRRQLQAMLEGSAVRHPQNEALATYTCKRVPDDNRIDWSGPAQRIHDLVRGVSHPYTGAYTHFEGRVLRVWRAHAVSGFPTYVGRIPGAVVERDAQTAVVLAGDGAVRLETVQLEGHPVANAAEVLRGLTNRLY